jgi:transposase-like protein
VNLSVTYEVAPEENPMALDKDALSELLDALRAGGDLDLVRSGLQLVLQALIEMEAAQQIGAAPHQRSPERTTHRNAHRARLLSTKAGDLELRIPKLRSGSFFETLHGGREVLGLAVGDSEDGAFERPSCARCVPGALAASDSSSPTPTRGSRGPSPR